MLTYGDDKKREAFRAAMERFRQDGLSLDDMASMITAAMNESRRTNGVHPKETEDVIYEPGELPEGLIDLNTAAEKYGCSIHRLRQWVTRGRLPRMGKLRAPAPGGGVVLVDETCLIQKLREPPNRGGRPRKKAV